MASKARRNSRSEHRDVVATFCRQIRARSAENMHAIHQLSRAGLHGVCVGLLRQELDSMVRVIFLLGISDKAERFALIRASVEGEMWRHSGGRRNRITDGEMVRFAQKLHNWTESVYRFGCAFIHLSEKHDYLARDPLRALPKSEQRDIIEHLRYYHGHPREENPGFAEIVPLVPRVFEKIASNLRVYVERLEHGKSLEMG
ncbi:hypothetical protein [Hyalangium versicolor]|uniref:hypothetical protein n=1 Tax=Hyalangium versicolor TaxID=2861190 RepID=UPI001CC98703|nr:hypothetical protein [Hyalangium versicolor]